MGIVTVTTFTSDTETVTKDKLNGLAQNVVTEFNGKIENSNIDDAAAIANSKLNLANVAQAVSLDGAVTCTSTLTCNGAVTLGNATGDDITITGSIAASIPLKDETVDIGTTALGLNDLHFGSGGIVNFDGGDVTITHSAAKLTFGGDGAVEIDFNNHEMTNVDINSGTFIGTLDGLVGIDFGSDATGDVYYRNSSGDLTRLAKGNSGEALKIGASIPEWGTAGALEFISVTALSTDTNSGNITIAADKLYLVRFDFSIITTASNVDLRFNSDATGYSYVTREARLNTTEAVADSGNSSATFIRFDASGTVAGGAHTGSFTIDTFKKSTDTAFVNGTSLNEVSSEEYAQNIFSGVYLDDATVTDFEIFVASGTLTGNIYLYSYQLV